MQPAEAAVGAADDVSSLACLCARACVRVYIGSGQLFGGAHAAREAFRACCSTGHRGQTPVGFFCVVYSFKSNQIEYTEEGLSPAEHRLQVGGEASASARCTWLGALAMCLLRGAPPPCAS